MGQTFISLTSFVPYLPYSARVGEQLGRYLSPFSSPLPQSGSQLYKLQKEKNSCIYSLRELNTRHEQKFIVKLAVC